MFELTTLTVEVLVKELKKRSLSTGGTKIELLERLAAALNSEGIDHALYVEELNRPEASDGITRDLRSSAKDGRNLAAQDFTRSVENPGTGPLAEVDGMNGESESIGLSRMFASGGGRPVNGLDDDSWSTVSSSASRRSSIAERRAEEAARIAGLKAKQEVLQQMNFIDEDVEKLQAAAQRLLLKRENMKVHAEIKEAEAREKVFTKFEADPTLNSLAGPTVKPKSNLRIDGNRQQYFNSEDPPPRLTRLNENVNEPQLNFDQERILPRNENLFRSSNSLREPNTRSTSQRESQNFDNSSEVMNTLITYNMKSLMPKIEITKFGGDHTEYLSFVKSFDHLIGSKLTDDDERLFYLEQHTCGKPRDIVKSCLHMEKKRGYMEARRLLDKRYGQKEKIVTAYIKKIMDWPKIEANNVDNLDEFAIVLRTCKNAISGENYLGNEMEHPKTLLKLINKLPYSAQDRFRRMADRIIEKECNTVTFGDVVEFVESEARVATNPLFGRRLFMENEKPTEVKKQKPEKVLVNNIRCWKCEQPHFLDKCPDLKSMNLEERKKFLKEKGMCFRCLRKGHQIKDCSSKFNCFICKGNHHAILHDQSEVKTEDEAEIELTSCKINERNGTTKMLVVPVKLKSDSGICVETCGFLDPGSSATFITDEVLKKLRPSSVNPTTLNVTTMNSTSRIKSKVVTGLVLKDYEERNSIPLPPVYSLSKIPADKDDCIDKKDLLSWPHLSDLDVPETKENIGILIGLDAHAAFLPSDVRRSPNNEDPYAVKTKIGWVVYGSKRNSTGVSVNRIKVDYGYSADVRSDIATVTRGCSADVSPSMSSAQWFSRPELVKRNSSERLEEPRASLKLKIDREIKQSKNSEERCIDFMTGLLRCCSFWIRIAGAVVWLSLCAHILMSSRRKFKCKPELESTLKDLDLAENNVL